MSKFDMSKLVQNVQKEFKNTSLATKIGTGNRLKQLGEEDFLKMPQWWIQATNTPGLPYGTGVVLAGRTDSGKTTGAIEAMKAAQAIGAGIIYAETENKTTEMDLVRKGIDPKGVAVLRSSISEELFTMLFSMWEEYRTNYPDNPLLIIVDSLGNTVSQRDSELNLVDGKQKPGGKGAGNRLALMKLLAKMEQSSKVALLIVSYTYANIGAPGRTVAGGDALGLLSSLIYMTSRKGWLEKTVKGEKVRIGAAVQWTLSKNHIFKDNPGPKQVTLNITSDGVECVGAKNVLESDEEDDIE